MGIAALVCGSEIQPVPCNRFFAVARQKHHGILHHPMAHYREHCHGHLPDTGAFEIYLLVCTNFSGDCRINTVV